VGAELTIERRLGGQPMRITPAERREIALAYLSDPDLGTKSACAKHFGRTREAIAGCLKGEEFEALARQVDHETGESAKGILKRGREKAATVWVKALDVAAEKGDHKPARDLLIATKVIAPLPSTGNLFININPLGPGPDRWKDMATGVVVDEIPDGATGIAIGVRDSDVQVSPAMLSSTPPVIDGEISK
jgi:hypothetical protein